MALKAPLSHRSVPPRIAFTMFLDFLGFGMIIPVSPSFFSAENHLLFSPETGASDRVLFYGLMMGFFGLSTFFFAPWLGAISDRLGRRKVLMITNICNGSLYGVSAWAILTANPVLFIISRIVPGMCGASVFIVQSSLSDVSNKENKANNLGWVGVSFGAGTILGALVGGLLADKSILPFAAHWIPFVTAMIFSSLNLLYVIFFLPETLRHRNPSRVTIL